MHTIRLAAFVLITLLLASLSALGQAPATVAAPQSQQALQPSPAVAGIRRPGFALAAVDTAAGRAKLNPFAAQTMASVPLVGENVPGAGQ